MYDRIHRSAFTLIELLVVIAIIAILAVVVVLTLNPAQLLAQSRDSNRVSDMATLNTAIGLYQTDSGGVGSMGTSSIVYTSLTDTSSTCGSLNLSSLTSGSYNCTVSTSTRNSNSTGWIPIDFTKISAGSPLGSLPIDPTNSSSTGLYYTYNTGGNSQFEVTALPESQKQKLALAQKPSIPNYPDVIANGSSLSISPMFNTSGLVGYWPMDEGTGSSTQDLSGNNNTGSWSGTAAGTNSTYYTAGKVGSYAGAFDGNSTAVGVGDNAALDPTNTVSMTAWLYTTSSTNAQAIVYKNEPCGAAGGYAMNLTGYGAGTFKVDATLGTTYHAVGPVGAVPMNQWTLVAVTYNGSVATVYINGSVAAAWGFSQTFTGLSGTSLFIGYRGCYNNFFVGLLDDVRVYNRALSAAEVQALYNATK